MVYADCRNRIDIIGRNIHISSHIIAIDGIYHETIENRSEKGVCLMKDARKY